MYQTASAPPADHSYSNGKLSPPPNRKEDSELLPSDSDSDLSEALDLPNGPSTFINGNEDKDADDEENELSEAETSQDEDAPGSDDSDYDAVTPPRPAGGSTGDARSSSQESPPQRKRKTGIEQDDYMLNDPELYGLRRSVSRIGSKTYYLAD